jgi:hypothetical protein
VFRNGALTTAKSPNGRKACIWIHSTCVCVAVEEREREREREKARESHRTIQEID